jgi:hypothetical protein
MSCQSNGSKFEARPEGGLGLKNLTLPARLSLEGARHILLVDPPSGLAEALGRAGDQTISVVEGRAIRSAKQPFDAIVAWQESRVGSRALLDLLARRLEPCGKLWVVTAMKKVRGPETPSIHRLELADLVKTFAPHGLRQDHEARLSAWHVAYRFVKRETGNE